MFDDIDMERLNSLLDLLKEKGVHEFESDGLRVKLAPSTNHVELPAPPPNLIKEPTLEDDLFYSAS